MGWWSGCVVLCVIGFANVVCITVEKIWSPMLEGLRISKYKYLVWNPQFSDLRIWEQGLWWVWDYKIIISWTYLFYWNWENMMEEQIWALEFFVHWTLRIGSIYAVYLECMTRTLPHWFLWVRQEQSLKVSIYSPHIKLFYIIFLSCLDFLHFLKKKFRFSSSIVSFLYMSLYCKIKWTLKLCKFVV